MRVRDVTFEVLSPELILVVNEFLNIISEELSSVSIGREIDFGIDLLPDIQPIYIAPY